MDAFERMIAGYRIFYQEHFIHDPELFNLLKTGQSPKSLMITCSDSRVSPLTLTKSKPGEVFAIRNVANLVPPYQPNPDSLHGVSAALEYAVCHLEIENIIVMGHSGCGGIKALREGIEPQSDDDFSFIKPWVEIARKAVDLAHDHDDPQTACEKEAVKLSVENLKTFPWIASRVKEGKLKLHGWYFTLEDGILKKLEDGRFAAV